MQTHFLHTFKAGAYAPFLLTYARLSCSDMDPDDACEGT